MIQIELTTIVAAVVSLTGWSALADEVAICTEG